MRVMLRLDIPDAEAVQDLVHNWLHEDGGIVISVDDTAYVANITYVKELTP